MLLVALSVPALAEESAPSMPSPEAMQKMQGLNPGPSMFAYAGSACPGGSEPYKGPEQALAAQSGAVYCIVNKTVIVYPKQIMQKCPSGMKAYEDTKAKPDADVIWCTVDASKQAKLAASRPSTSVPGSGAVVTPPPMLTNGEIVRIDGKVLVLKNVSGPFGASDIERRFKISSDTAAVEHKGKDPKKMQAEQEAFQTEMQKGYATGNLPPPPMPFEEEKISLSKLREGDRVTVSADMQKDDETSVAVRIVRQQASVMPSSLQPSAPPVPPNSNAPLPPAAPAAITNAAPPAPSGTAKPGKPAD